MFQLVDDTLRTTSEAEGKLKLTLHCYQAYSMGPAVLAQGATD